MADVITRLKLESGEYDSKVKRATQGLLQMEQECRKVGGTLAILEKEQKQYVQSLGSMQTVSTTVRGKLGELTQAYTELRVQYNRLTEEEKKGDFGKALSSSLDQLNQRIQQTKKELSDVNKELSGMDKLEAGGLFGGSKISGMLQVFGGNVMTKGFEMAAGAVSSMVNEIGDCIKQGVELAKQGEGIRIAFDRLGRGDILEGLREATHGTVTDLELMKAAVKFNDFKLPVEELGTMLAFAQQKAKDTGQSVDYMVDSIVTGLGRKSLMILDNLGLSAAEIKERMKETGDMTKAVGAIIRDQMAQAGDYVETAADRAAQANVSLQNKMEELGRKFAPIEEASNQLWTSMKIGILDIIGGPLARMLNELTEAGRQINALRDINGDGSNGSETRSGKALRILREYSGGGRGIEGKRELYDRQVASFQNQEEKEWRKANRLRDELAGLRKQQRENGAAGNLSPLIQETSRQLEEAVSRAKAFQIARNEYVKGAKDIMKPVKVNIQSDNAIKSVDELKVKLAELQAQRKKVAAGSDEAKRLDTEIRQVKADIKLQNPNALKTTATTTPKEKAAEMVSTAERTHAETLEKAAIRKEVGLDSELENKKKTLSARERLFDAYNDAYATYKDPKYKEAANEAANKIKSLAGEVKQMEDAVKAAKIKWEQGASGFNQKTMSAWMQGRQSDLSKVEYGTKEYKDISANIADMNSIKTVLDTAIKNAIDTTQIDMTPLWSKMFGETLPEGATASLSDALTKMYEQAFDNVNIDDASLQDVIDKINEKLKELGIKPIKINFETGNIANVGKETEKSWRGAASAMSAAGSALQGLEDPGAKIAGIVGQAIANIALGFSQATAASSGGGIFGWIAAIAGGLTTMISTISAIHSATGYAQGGIIDGRGGGFVGGMAYSGDNVGNVRLDSGELVLNRAQQNNLANALEGGNNYNVENRQPYVNGELIYLGLNNYLKRTGRGEIVVSKR